MWALIAALSLSRRIYTMLSSLDNNNNNNNNRGLVYKTGRTTAQGLRSKGLKLGLWSWILGWLDIDVHT